MPEAELLPVGDIVVGNRVRKDPLAYLSQLSESIRVLGMMQPIVVNSRNELVAGFRRLAAAKKLGWTEVPVRRVAALDDALNALRGERDENACRAVMSYSELVELGRMIEALERPRAKARQKAGGEAGAKQTNTKLGPTVLPPGSGNLPEPGRGNTRDKVADALGIGARTYEKAKAVVTASEAEPEKFADVAAEMDRTGKVDPAFKELKRRAANAAPPAPRDPDPGPARPPEPVPPLDLLSACDLILPRFFPDPDGLGFRAVVSESQMAAFRGAVESARNKV